MNAHGGGEEKPPEQKRCVSNEEEPPTPPPSLPALFPHHFNSSPLPPPCPSPIFLYFDPPPPHWQSETVPKHLVSSLRTRVVFVVIIGQMLCKNAAAASAWLHKNEALAPYPLFISVFYKLALKIIRILLKCIVKFASSCIWILNQNGN